MNLGSILSIVLFALAFIGVVKANDQQLQQTCMNAGVCLLAVSSGSSGRRSDLQAHQLRECRGSVRHTGEMIGVRRQRLEPSRTG
jgi:hypothetical protein